MRLADELRGIKPRKTLTGRVVINDDPVEVKPIPRIPALHRVRAFVEKVRGDFSAHDVAWECGIPRKVAAEYLSRFKKAGLIRRVGYVAVVRNVRMNLWRRV